MVSCGDKAGGNRCGQKPEVFLQPIKSARIVSSSTQEFYKKTFSDQVRKGFTGQHNMNVAEGSYRMIQGSAPKNIDGPPMYGTIGQMKDKAAYKYGMHGDRNEMGKKAMMQKMKDYFPQQSDYLTEDGRAIGVDHADDDANAPPAVDASTNVLLDVGGDLRRRGCMKC